MIQEQNLLLENQKRASHKMREEEKELAEVVEESDEEDNRRNASSVSDGFSNYGESNTNILIRSPIGHSDTLEETIK